MIEEEPTVHKPRVSVVLTSYNHKRFLKDAIDSVLNQTFEDFELIVSDDASTDGSQDIIRSYTDPRIKPVLWERTGRRKNHGRAFYAARGEYLAIHHSDDIWVPEKLETQLALLAAAPQFAAVFSGVEGIDENGVPVKDAMIDCFATNNMTRHQWLRTFFFGGNRLCHPSVLMRREFVKTVYPVATSLVQLPDFMGWINLCFHSGLYILPQPLVKFRVHSNRSNSSAPTPENFIRHFNELHHILQKYRHIKDVGEWMKIFPEFKEFVVNGQIDIDFAFANVCLACKNSFAHTQLGLEILYSLLDDQERSASLFKMYGFDSESLRKISGASDVYGIGVAREVKPHGGVHEKKEKAEQRAEMVM